MSFVVKKKFNLACPMPGSSRRTSAGGIHTYIHIYVCTLYIIAKGSPYLGTVLELSTLRQHDRLLRRAVTDDPRLVTGQQGSPPPPRANSFPGLELYARRAQAEGGTKLKHRTKLGRTLC